MRMIATITAVLLLAGCGSNQDEPTTQASTAPTTPATFTTTGTYTVTLDGLTMQPGEACGEVSRYNYPDIIKGAQVTVRSSTAEVLAVGALSDGKYRPNPEWQNLYGYCVFPFTVPAVPDGRPLYTIEVSHRGVTSYPRAKLDKPVSIVLTDG
jgi:hypothetical protein